MTDLELRGTCLAQWKAGRGVDSMNGIKFLPVAAASLLALTAGGAQANTFTYTAFNASNVAIGTATFTTSTDTLTVALSNLIQDPAGASELLRGIGFDITPNTSPSITSQKGTLVGVDKDGNITSTTPNS